MDDLATDPAPSSELGEQAYGSIRRDIILGVLRPGAEITEAQLATRYGLGRAPIRSGLTRLRQEGLVRSLARRGFIVAPITLRSVQDNLVVRFALEPLATRMAVGRIDPKLLRESQRPYPTAGDPARTIDFVRSNREFHVMIAEASGNRTLASFISRLIDEVDRILHLAQFGPGISVEARARKIKDLGDHTAIIEAFEAGNADMAAEAARDHLERSRTFVMSTLLEIDGAWAVDRS